MKPNLLLPCRRFLLATLLGISPVILANDASDRGPLSYLKQQVPGWSAKDLEYFLHGSMSTEIAPENVLRAFIQTYPDLFTKSDLRNFGLIPDSSFGWPIGFSRSRVAHLGEMAAVGINCAACHVGEVSPSATARPVRVLGMTSHFDAEAFFGALTVAGFRTADPANLKRFLGAYLQANDPDCGQQGQAALLEQWQRQEPRIAAALSDDPMGAKHIAAGELHRIAEPALRLDRKVLKEGADLPALANALLQLFHNMRAALHIPDQPPEKLPPASGPGRNDAFGLLSAVLFGTSQPYAPVKYGLVWNLEHRHWVHWDGNTQSPIGRNLLAALGLGAPLSGHLGNLQFDLVKRQTKLSESIRPPRYPFAIDQAAARRGHEFYQANCATCHDGPETDARLHEPAEVGTEPQRAQLFTQLQADRFDQFLAELKVPGYVPPKEPGIRSTQKYWAPSLAGVWARSPYLHNGSVRTLADLLESPDKRQKSFRRGGKVYDPVHMGYQDEGPYVLDTTAAGNANAGHNYGVDLSVSQKRDLMEYLKGL